MCDRRLVLSAWVQTLGVVLSTAGGFPSLPLDMRHAGGPANWRSTRAESVHVTQPFSVMSSHTVSALGHCNHGRNLEMVEVLRLSCSLLQSAFFCPLFYVTQTLLSQVRRNKMQFNALKVPELLSTGLSDSQTVSSPPAFSRARVKVVWSLSSSENDLLSGHLSELIKAARSDLPLLDGPTRRKPVRPVAQCQHI